MPEPFIKPEVAVVPGIDAVRAQYGVGGDSVQLVGTNFQSAQSTSTVTVGGLSAGVSGNDRQAETHGLQVDDAEALGQICDRSAYAALQKRLNDEDEGVRAKTRWALSRLKKAGARAAASLA